MNNHYDWKEIQKRYDEGLSYRDVSKEFGVTTANIAKAVRRGDLKTRNASESQKVRQKLFPRVLSAERRKEISDSRRKYLENNPDKVPYLLNHSSKKSYPEELLEKAFLDSGLTEFQYNYQSGIYQYDFAFVKDKIDVEVDGGTHLTEKVKKIDQRRDEWSIKNGWKVVRFTAKEVKDSPTLCAEKVKMLLKH